VDRLAEPAIHFVQGIGVERAEGANVVEGIGTRNLLLQ
jgi:hypothetical protein